MKTNNDLEMMAVELRGAAGNLTILENVFEEDEIVPSRQVISEAIFAVRRLLERISDDLDAFALES